jgi:pyridoxamine 5'-phosphate oxidase
MRDSFDDIRREYQKDRLSRENLHENPYLQLKQWLQDAIAANCPDPTAMVLATSDEKNHPDTRIVLLKNCDDGAIWFFTNFDSHKGKQLEANPFAALNFYWSALERQVRVKGKVSRINDADADAYFAKRPKASQLAASASKQSEIISSRADVEQAYTKLEQEYKDKALPRPTNWGGYQLSADYFEFWQGCSNRLHDRFTYEQQAGTWVISCLAP